MQASDLVQYYQYLLAGELFLSPLYWRVSGGAQMDRVMSEEHLSRPSRGEVGNRCRFALDTRVSGFTSGRKRDSAARARRGRSSPAELVGYLFSLAFILGDSKQRPCFIF